MSKLIRVVLLIVFFGAVLPNDVSPKDSRFTVNKKSANRRKGTIFRRALTAVFARRGLKMSELCDESDSVSQRILLAYGAIFLASEKVVPPPVCIFTSPEQVDNFQSKITISTDNINGAKIELQQAAMNQLSAARREAMAKHLNITPRDGSEAARRSYEDTVRLWNSRFLPALEHWRKRGRLNVRDVEQMMALGFHAQVRAVIEREEQGIFFSRDFSKSILYSVAAPGASQHLSLLAFDANEFADVRVRKILARHGWFRTVRNDSPHFTFLGMAENELPAHGLRKISTAEGEFWILDNSAAE